MQLRKVTLDEIVYPYFKCDIGYNSLRHLGLCVVFMRPKSSPGEYTRIVYSLMDLNIETKRLAREMQETMKRGILKQLPRDGLTITIILKQIPRRGVNIRIDKLSYGFYGCMLYKKNENTGEYEIVDIMIDDVNTKKVILNHVSETRYPL